MKVVATFAISYTKAVRVCQIQRAVFKTGLSKSAGAVTLSNMCGSRMKSPMLAHDMILAGTQEVMVAGGSWL